MNRAPLERGLEKLTKNINLDAKQATMKKMETNWTDVTMMATGMLICMLAVVPDYFGFPHLIKYSAQFWVSLLQDFVGRILYIT